MRQIFDSSKQEEFADDNFEVDGNGLRFYKRIENTVGKEKLLVTSNFSFSLSVFKRLVLQTRKNQGLFGKGLIWTKRQIFYTSKLEEFADDNFEFDGNG